MSEFYTGRPCNSLRLGDIVKGFVLGAARITKPDTSLSDYQVSIRNPTYCVVLTPCCSVGAKTLALAPLNEILPSWLDNAYFAEDFTNINREMDPEQSVPAQIWRTMPEAEQKRRLQRGKAFALGEYFVYAPHDLLGDYSLRLKGGSSKEISFRAVDFRMIYRVECDSVVNIKQVPLEAKVLELTIETRSQLRIKLAKYFARIPDEDSI